MASASSSFLRKFWHKSLITAHFRPNYWSTKPKQKSKSAHVKSKLAALISELASPTKFHSSCPTTSKVDTAQQPNSDTSTHKYSFSALELTSFTTLYLELAAASRSKSYCTEYELSREVGIFRRATQV